MIPFEGYAPRNKNFFRAFGALLGGTDVREV
jgi:hypothetical protein